MKKILLLIILSLFVIAANAQNKKLFDLTAPGIHKDAGLRSVSDFSSRQFQNDKVQITMIAGGYFTIGTTNGVSSSKLDDNCAVTFGHPYALTSYPVISVDGKWYKPDDYFSSSSELITDKSGDTLTFTATNNSKVLFSFSMICIGDSIKIIQKIKNLDSGTHTFGLGLVMDPGLGKCGDGSLGNQNEFVTQGSVFENSAVPSELNVWEKSSGAKGMGIDISYENKPSKIIAANWADVYSDPSPSFTTDMQKTIYDLDLKFYWTEETLSTGQEKSCVTTVALAQPDFSAQAFLRWDLPNFLTIDNNLMFPQKFSTYVELYKSGNSTLNSPSLSLELPSIFNSGFSTQSLLLNESNPAYVRIDIGTHISYEDKIVDVSAKLMDGSQVIDEIHRNIFIPATPVSDTGLVVTIDSSMTGSYPKMDIAFNVKVKSNDYFVSNLTPDNIFLYDNDQRVTAFTLGKDLSGGINSVDFVFALDVTGSMGNIIDGVKNNIIEFADSLSARGVDYRLGLVTFLDEVENIYPFTNDATDFQNIIAQQYAHGGGDGPENSLQALLNASKFPFRKNAKHIIIWITDSNYHENDDVTPLTKIEVVNALLASDATVNSVGTSIYKSEYYDPIINPTGGDYYDINGNFRDIMLQMSRLNSSNKYIISFNVLDQSQIDHQIKLMVKYTGLGGNAVYNFNQSGQKTAIHRLAFYPNPFNPEITFQIKKGNYVNGKIKIYNLLGQQIKEFSLNESSSPSVVWNAHNNKGIQISSGFYIVQLILTDKNLRDYVENAKILFLK